jgi:hypothetical protein
MLQEASTKKKTASNVHRQCTSKGSLYHHLTVPHINSNNFAMTFMTFDCGDICDYKTCKSGLKQPVQ